MGGREETDVAEIMNFFAEAACDGRYAALLLVTICMVTDMAVSRIYNFVTASSAAAGIAVLVADGRALQIPAAAGMAALTLAFLIPFYHVGGIGAGDCKLLVALCFLLPRQQYVRCLFTSLLFGAVTGLFVLFVSHGHRHSIHFAVPVGISTVFCIGGVLEPVYRYL